MKLILKLLIIILLIVPLRFSFCQSNEIGFKYEPYILVYQNNVEIPLSYRDDGVSFYPFSLYLSYTHQISDVVGVTFQPGILLGDQSYKGIELITFSKYFWENSNYIFGGLNVHFNSGFGSISVKEAAIVLLTFGAGFGLSNLIDLEIRYELPLNNKIIYRSKIDDFEKSVNGLLKIGVGFSFDL